MVAKAMEPRHLTYDEEEREKEIVEMQEHEEGVL